MDSRKQVSAVPRTRGGARKDSAVEGCTALVPARSEARGQYCSVECSGAGRKGRAGLLLGRRHPVTPRRGRPARLVSGGEPRGTGAVCRAAQRAADRRPGTSRDGDSRACEDARGRSGLLEQRLRAVRAGTRREGRRSAQRERHRCAAGRGSASRGAGCGRDTGGSAVFGVHALLQGMGRRSQSEPSACCRGLRRRSRTPAPGR